MLTGIWVIAVGAVLSLMGFGRVPVSTNPDENAAFHQQWGILCRIAGLGLVVVGAAILVFKLRVIGFLRVVGVAVVLVAAVVLFFQLRKSGRA